MRLVLIVWFTALFMACNSNQHEGNLKLNNGEKWKINTEMKPNVDAGREILNDYLSGDDRDYLQLSKDLNAQNKNLIKSCTMTGESHDELHKWLLPHMELIDDLSKANDEEEADLIIVQIEESFDTFQDYFE